MRISDWSSDVCSSDLIAKGDFGSTIDPVLGTQTVNFLTNLDTTGGNSGSAVLDANGRLIGLHFDSNWEAVSASWMFDPRYKRGIHVDTRYTRWLMSKVYQSEAHTSELQSLMRISYDDISLK